MRQSWIEKLVGIALSIVAGTITHFLLHEFVISLLATLVLLLVSLIVLAREFPIKFFLDRSSRRHLGLVATYRNQDAAMYSMLKRATSSRRISILLVRGHRFILDEDSVLDKVLKSAGPDANVQLLILNPEAPAMEGMLEKMGLNDDQRRTYLAKCTLVKQKLDAFVARNLVSYQYYNSPPVWKLLVTDNSVFAGGYDPRLRGSHIPLGEYENGGNSTYVGFVSHFDSLWASCLLSKKSTT